MNQRVLQLSGRRRKNRSFNRRKFQFENGEVLRLKMYEHLKVG